MYGLLGGPSSGGWARRSGAMALPWLWAGTVVGVLRYRHRSNGVIPMWDRSAIRLAPGGGAVAVRPPVAGLFPRRVDRQQQLGRYRSAGNGARGPERRSTRAGAETPATLGDPERIGSGNAAPSARGSSTTRCFNEARAPWLGKWSDPMNQVDAGRRASMRPERLGSGNKGCRGSSSGVPPASMRPERLGSGNDAAAEHARYVLRASMRPERLGSGNPP